MSLFVVLGVDIMLCIYDQLFKVQSMGNGIFHCTGDDFVALGLTDRTAFAWLKNAFNTWIHLGNSIPENTETRRHLRKRCLTLRKFRARS